MGRAKDLWMDEVERLAEDLVEGGMDEGDAYELACEQAMGRVTERMYEAADNARDRAKYEGL